MRCLYWLYQLIPVYIYTVPLATPHSHVTQSFGHVTTPGSRDYSGIPWTINFPARVNSIERRRISLSMTIRDSVKSRSCLVIMSRDHVLSLCHVIKSWILYYILFSTHKRGGSIVLLITGTLLLFCTIQIVDTLYNMIGYRCVISPGKRTRSQDKD